MSLYGGRFDLWKAVVSVDGKPTNVVNVDGTLNLVNYLSGIQLSSLSKPISNSSFSFSLVKDNIYYLDGEYQNGRMIQNFGGDSGVVESTIFRDVTMFNEDSLFVGGGFVGGGYPVNLDFYNIPYEKITEIINANGVLEDLNRIDLSNLEKARLVENGELTLTGDKLNISNISDVVGFDSTNHNLMIMSFTHEGGVILPSFKIGTTSSSISYDDDTISVYSSSILQISNVLRTRVTSGSDMNFQVSRLLVRELGGFDRGQKYFRLEKEGKDIGDGENSSGVIEIKPNEKIILPYKSQSELMANAVVLQLEGDLEGVTVESQRGFKGITRNKKRVLGKGKTHSFFNDYGYLTNMFGKYSYNKTNDDVLYIISNNTSKTVSMSTPRIVSSSDVSEGLVDDSFTTNSEVVYNNNYHKPSGLTKNTDIVIDNETYPKPKMPSGYHIFEGKLYYGESVNVGYAVFEGNLYNGGNLNVGAYMHETVLYNGSIANTGLLMYNGKLYNSQVLNVGYAIYENKLYNGSVLNVGYTIFETNLYKDSALNVGYALHNTKLYKDSTLNVGYTLFEGKLYDGSVLNAKYVVFETKLYNGSIPNVGYTLFETKLYNGATLNVGYALFETKLYKDSALNVGYALFGGKLYKDSILNVGLALFEGNLYNGEVLNTGYMLYNSKLYNGAILNVGQALYNGELYNGSDYNVGLALYNEILYDGKSISVGTVVFNGLTYINGVKFVEDYTLVNGKLQYKGSPNVGYAIYKDNLYLNEDLNIGYAVHLGLLYNGSTLNVGYVIHDNKLYNGSSINNGMVVFEGKLYNGTALNVGYVLFEAKLYNGSALNVGYALFENKLYEDSILNVGMVVFENKLYKDSILNVGYTLFELKLYNGSVLNVGYVLFETKLYKDSTLNVGYALFEGKLYKDTVFNVGLATHEGKLYNDTVLYSGIHTDGKWYENGVLIVGYKVLVGITINDFDKLYNDGSLTVGEVRYQENLYKDGVLYTGTMIRDGKDIKVVGGQVIELNNILNINTIILPKGDYTISADIKSNIDIPLDKSVQVVGMEDIDDMSQFILKTGKVVANEWTRVFSVVRLEKSRNLKVYVTNNLTKEKFGTLENGSLSIRAIQVERGSIPTDWGVSDLDIKRDDESLEQKITNAEKQFNDVSTATNNKVTILGQEINDKTLELNKQLLEKTDLLGTQIKQTEKDVTIAVKNETKNNILSYIQASTEGIMIGGNRVQIDGATKIVGTFNVNNRFTVDSLGNMKAVNGIFSGDITGGTISIGSNFTVDSVGNMVTKNGTFSGNIIGGTMSIGSNFSVDSYGNMISKNATINGVIQGGTADGTGQYPFQVNKDGSTYMSKARITNNGEYVNGFISNMELSGAKLISKSRISRQLQDYQTINGKTVYYDTMATVGDGAIRVSAVNKSLSTGSYTGFPSFTQRSVYLTDRGISTMFDGFNGVISSGGESQQKTDATRFIDFFPNENATNQDNSSTRGMHIYSGQGLTIEGGFSNGASMTISAYSDMYISSQTGVVNINGSRFTGNSFALGGTFSEATANTTSPNNVGIGSNNIYATRVYAGALYDGGSRVATSSELNQYAKTSALNSYWRIGSTGAISSSVYIGGASIGVGGEFNGSSSTRNVSLGSSNIYAPGKVYAGGVAVTSSRDKKKNIVTYKKDVLEDVASMRAVTYQLNEDNDNELHRLGFILEEVPSAYLIDTEGGIDQYALITMSVKATQELYEKTKLIESQMLKQQAEIDELKALVQSLISK